MTFSPTTFVGDKVIWRWTNIWGEELELVSAGMSGTGLTGREYGLFFFRALARLVSECAEDSDDGPVGG
jgi:hypothetical protein